MEKTVIFEFPDNFKFPLLFDSVYGPCPECPMFCRCDSGEEWCFLVGYISPLDAFCPFYCGEETVKKEGEA